MQASLRTAFVIELSESRQHPDCYYSPAAYMKDGSSCEMQRVGRADFVEELCTDVRNHGLLLATSSARSGTQRTGLFMGRVPSGSQQR